MAKRKKKEAFDWEDEDQEEIIWVSKSEIKRDAEDLKQLGEKLVNLTKANLTKVPLDDNLKDAIELAQRLQKDFFKFFYHFEYRQHDRYFAYPFFYHCNW